MNRTLCLLTILLGAATFAVAETPRRSFQDPPTEDALWKEMNDHLQKDRAPQAAETLEKLIAAYPNSARMPMAIFTLAGLEERRGRAAKAAERYGEFVKRYPKHDNAAQALLQRASLFARLRKKEEAKAEFKRLFKEYPGSNASQNGLWQYWNLDNKHFQFTVNRTFAEGQPVSVQSFLRNVDRVDYKLFRLDTAALIKRLEGGAAFHSIQELMATVPASGREKLRDWSDEPRTDANRYQQNDIKIDVPGPGLYIVQAEHDGIPVEVGVIVARYGLIVKSAPNRSVFFSVDRRTGRAVPGMTLRLTEGDKKSTVTTGTDGLYVLDRSFNGTVVGIAEGDLAMTNAGSYGSGEEFMGYLFTDRPIYRPLQTVHFKGIHRIRKPDDGGAPEFANVGGKPVKITIRDTRGNVVYEKDLVTGDGGSVSGDFRLGDEPPLGHYYIQSSLGGYAQFRVEEYRKPEYEVKVGFDRGARLQGEDLKVEASVAYYFGSPVVESEVTYEVRRRPYYKNVWRCFYAEWDWFDDGDDDGGDDDEDGPRIRRRHVGWGPVETVTKGTGRTDKEGKFRFTCPTTKGDKDHIYTAIVRVTDRSRRQVEGSADVKVARSNLELNLASSRYVYAPGDSITVRAKLSDLEGKPVADHAVEIRGTLAEWRRRGDKGDYDHEEFFKGTMRTDALGVAEISIPADKEGYVRVRCAVKDGNGTEIAEERWLWVSGGSWSAGYQNFTGLEVRPDREIYKTGETATVLITSQVRSAHVLFTVECDGLYRHELVKVKEHSAMLQVPIEARHSPNVFFSAVTMSGNELLSSSKSVSVPPVDRLLTVKVKTDRERYRPREKATVTVEVTDAAGRPVATELSLGLVDESIYALQKELVPDIRKFFFARRWNRVSLSNSMVFFDYGRAGDKDAAAPGAEASFGRARGAVSELKKAKESRDDEGMAETEVRGNFPDTWTWKPNAATDAAGRFTFETEVPDSLTTWRATVRAATTDTRVGQARLEFIARKEVIIRLETPRFFTQKDACVVSGVIHNYRDDVDEIRVTLEATGVKVLGDLKTTIRVPKGEDRRVDWKIEAPAAGVARITARAESPKESDAMKLEIPILPHGTLESITRAGASEGAVRETVTLPATAIREASELTISVAPSVASQITGALEYLAGYPYGCVEQTMSRFLPSVVAARAMKQMGVRHPKLEAELPDMVAAGLQRLYNFQHYDGGWGWWEADQSHPYMTAYVVYGLAKAKEAEQSVDPNVLERGLQALRNLFARGQTTDDNRGGGKLLPEDTRAYLLFAMSEAGSADAKGLDEIYSKRNDLSDYGRAILAISLARAGRADDARTVLAELDATAKQGEAYCYWEGHVQRWHWMSHSIETTAYVLRAYSQVAPKDAKIHKILRWLAANRHGNRWHSTKDTAAIVYALAEHAAKSGELDAEFALTVKVNGKELMSAKVDKSNLLTFDGTRVIKGLDVPAGATEVEIVREGKGVLYYSVHLKCFNAADVFTPSKGSVAISRSYAKVRWEGKEKIAEELKEGDTVKSGDIVEVTLVLDASGLHEYMMIEDPIPAGFEIQKEEDRFYGGWHGRWGWWYSRIEARDEKVCVAATSLNGTQSVTYLLRAETPGEYRILPTRAWNMYVPEIAGSSAGFRLGVKD